MASGPVPITFPKDLLSAEYLARWTVVWLNTDFLLFFSCSGRRNSVRKPCSDNE